MTPEEIRELFKTLGAIEAYQTNIQSDIAEIKKEQTSQRETITGIRIKSARDAGGVAALIAILISAAGLAIKGLFFGGHN